MAARSTLEPSLLETLEGIASETRGWDALAEAVTLGLRSSALKLSTELARELHARVAIWHKSMRRDDEAAEASLLRAIAADGRHGPTLIALADIQRRTPSEALCDTLLALFELDPNNLDPLLEASAVAREAIADADKRLAIWQRLFDRAADLLRQRAETRGEASAAHCARWALDQLASALTASDPERAYGLLLGASGLGFDAELKREDLHRAARLAGAQLKDAVRAMALYRDLLQADPLDRDAMRELGAAYRSADRLPELLMLRRHELSLERNDDRQLELRLEIVSILGEMEERGGRTHALLENLRARPGHASTLAAVSDLYTAQGRHGEHAELLRKQAEQLAKNAETERAAQLLQRAATIYERDLQNPDAAIATYRELYELDTAGEATAALARLYAARGDHAQAARWLELRLGTVPPDTRAVTGVELGHALLEAGQRERARACLEQALRDDASLRDARSLLAQLYREDSAFEPLAGLLAEGAVHERDVTARLALLTEAASIYCDTLASPERGLSALQRAAELAPQDRPLQIKHAEVLSACGQHDRARAVYEQLIEGYGKKRSPERAELHYRAARAAQAAGEIPRAFEQLETATKMDLAHVPAMHMLADLSREQGDLDRAERTYRGLLMLVRRHKPGELQSLGPSEIFFALGTIADARGQKQQAGELLESAMESATQSDAEARRFQELLRKRGQTDLLMRVLEARMKLAQDAAGEADVLATKADVLAESLGQPKQALDALLAAIGLTPDADALHEKARKLARAQRALDRYLERIAGIADEAGRRKDEASQKLCARLTLRQGEAIERDLQDYDRAAGLYAKVESSGHHVVDSWLAIARVAGARGDTGEQRRVLQQIEGLGNDRVSAEQRREVMFQLVEIELGNDTWRDAGVATLERALPGLSDYERAKSVLRAAVERAPKHDKLAALFERVARAAHDDAMLLEHLERRAARKGAGVEEQREGIELALRMGEHVRAERILKRMLKAGADDAAKSSWAYARLSECRVRAADMPGAIVYLSQAADRAEGAEADALYRELARLAGGERGDLEVAASAYMRLLERDRGDRSAWQPLLDVYLRMGDAARFESCAQELVAQLPLAADRVAVHMMRARFLLEVARDERAAVPVLKALLEDEPSNREATDLLTQILQKLGMNKELAQLLQIHFDRARDEQNVQAIAELGLRIAELYGERNANQAIDALRAALSWVPAHPGLLRALLERMGPEAEARERADVMQALLEIERGEEAARLALQLSAMWTELGEAGHAQHALELGFQQHPEHAGLRDRLEAFYAERQMWRPLGELLERQAERLGATGEAVGRLKNAASLYRDELQDLDAAASALRKALAIVPEDLSLLGELARNLAATGQHRTAIEDVTRILTDHPHAGVVHADLLKVRAELRLAVEEVEAAASDLEQAYELDPGTTRGALIDTLERLKTAAFTRGDNVLERKIVMRLIELHEASGDYAGAREALAGWVEQSPEDAEALRSLRERDVAAGRWQDVVRTCERLLNLDTGKARTTTAIALADAYAMAGNPGGARGALERAHKEDPRDTELRTHLRALYETIGAHAELAGILLADAYAIKDPRDRVTLLQRTARLYLQAGDPGAALGPLGEAAKLQPDDSESQLLMIDISIQLGKLPQALAALETAITAQKRRRSPELAQLYQRMARVAVAQNDREEQLKWLNQAAEIDRKSGEIASELAEAALAAENYDMAMKALRALTMMDDPRPITRALAFLKQAQIAHLRGDPRRAQHWARKAKSLDDSLSEADTFLAEIGG
jgi:tetratricopeptide (TPR) repeat protein